MEPSKQAAAYAVSLAKRLNAEVCLLHIIETSGLISKFFESGNLLVKVTDRAKEQLHELLKELEHIDWIFSKSVVSQDSRILLNNWACQHP